MQSHLELARGKWRGILTAYGLEKFLSGQQCPCPICGGKDRFRFDDKDGNGMYFCNQCGAGNGFHLLMKTGGFSFRAACQAVERVVGKLQVDQPVRERKPREQQLRDMQRAWDRARGGRNTPAERYLLSRGLKPILPDILRDALRASGTEMLARVTDPTGKLAQIHRTILTPEGEKIGRKLMPGEWPRGSAVQLLNWDEGPLGIAEGIETALSAAILFNVPVWAALSADKLASWCPPRGATEVMIFGDNDASFTGQHVAFELARRLTSHGTEGRGLNVSVQIPRCIGEDWNDVLLEHVS